MSKIHLLPSDIIAKIAAGEVIERPSFAVKELIENALDAKADEITIFVEDAGLKTIQVTDNGEGMTKEDLGQSWKPHTTSKISANDALIGIKSFGFRGEALASLSAVSHLFIKSRTKDSPLGHQIEIRNGLFQKSSPLGMPQGTVVIVKDLFATIPARKKFLKSNQTELRFIVDIVTSYAIAHPEIRFTLKNDRKQLFDVPKNQTLTERVAMLFNQPTAEFFIPVQGDEFPLQLSGFIAKPQKNSSSTAKQFLFVNKRKISDKLISLAVKEAYGTMLEPTAYPIFVLFLSIPYEMVDVNVHPRKETVSFINNQTIFQAIKHIISSTLAENNITFQNLSWKKSGVGTTHTFAANILRKQVLEKATFKKDRLTTTNQIHDTYIIYETKNGFIIIDQHAAHERILFEKLTSEFLKQKRKHQTYQLEQPFVLTVSKQEQLTIEEYKKLFEKLGFTLVSTDSSPERKIVITHVPMLFSDRDPQESITGMIETLQEEMPIKQVDTVSEEMIAFLACRSAVKAGDILNQQQMEKIVEELETSPNNATCPHGRPTRIYTSIDELHHLFKR